MASNRIHIKGGYSYEEYTIGEANLYPGMLVELNSSGNVVAHDDEGGRGVCMILMEDALQGNTVDTVYTNATVGLVIQPYKGTEVNVLIEDGQNIAIGTELISAGNGKFKAKADLESGETHDQTIGVAAEACDLTGSNSSDTLCRMIVN